MSLAPPPHQSALASDLPTPKDEKQSLEQKPPAPTLPAGVIPDGGFDAYLQVLGAHFLFFNSW